MLVGGMREGFDVFAERHGLQLDGAATTSRGLAAGATATALTKATARSFGHEWTRYGDFGWVAREGEYERELDITDFTATYQEHLLAHTLPTFRRKTLLGDDELAGRLVLDAGCGNGRYAHVANRLGAEVVAVDLSGAVDAAFANTRGLAACHVVQADLFDLPFVEGTFDVVYSIGVLHHTPSVERAIGALARRLRPGGVLSVHLYRRRTPLFEIVDRSLRLVTTRLSLSWCWRLSHLPTVAGRLLCHSRVLFAAANAVIAVQPSHHHNFDWYCAPLASHHREGQVARWLREAGLAELSDDDPRTHGGSYYARIYPRWARRPDGSVRPTVHALCPHWALTVRGRLGAGREGAREGAGA
jgi:SAM-dependent methyltransferase